MCTRMDKCNLYNPEAPWDLCVGGSGISSQYWQCNGRVAECCRLNVLQNDRVVSHPSTGSVMVG